MLNSKKLVRNVGLKLALGTLFASLCVVSGCTIHAGDKGADGEKRVDIKSPMGDLHVSEEVDIRDAGLSLYPGARPSPKEDSDDKKGGNVNLSIPGFSLKVVAAEFLSDDAPEKIIGYYDQDMRKFGKIIQCHSDWNGAHANYDNKDETSKPVSCGNDVKGDAVELKVGTEGNQHIVAVKHNGQGSRFALVYVRIHTGKDDTI